MQIYTQNYPVYKQDLNQNRMYFLVNQLGTQIKFPNIYRNYCEFNFPLVNNIVQYKDRAIPVLIDFLNRSNNEAAIAEGIYTIDRMIEAKVPGVEKTYPVLSRFNNTNSPVIQTLLAGVYRKLQIPDAYGPLCKMLIRDSLRPDYAFFDPTEEIGGAILDYIRNQQAINYYSKSQ